MFLIIHDAKTKNRKSKGFGWSFEVFFFSLFSFSEQLSMYVHFSLELKGALLSFMPVAFLVCTFSTVAWQKRSFPVLQFLSAWFQIELQQCNPDGMFHLELL